VAEKALSKIRRIMMTKEKLLQQIDRKIKNVESEIRPTKEGSDTETGDPFLEGLTQGLNQAYRLIQKLSDNCCDSDCIEPVPVFKNWTPHTICVFSASGEQIFSVPPEPESIRAEESVIPAFQIAGIPVVDKSYNPPELPDPEENTIHIVSYVVLQASVKKRHDIVCPDTGPESVVRDENGNVLGVKRFQF
jgi:hypothetical protein